MNCRTFAIGSLRLGILAILLSDPIISSFVVASSFHVFTSRAGTACCAACHRQPRDHWNIGGHVTCWACKSLLEPWLVRRFRCSQLCLPWDILCIVGLTALSYLLHLNAQYRWHHTKISSGFQNLPTLPRLDLLPQLSPAPLPSFLIYMFAKRHGIRGPALTRVCSPSAGTATSSAPSSSAIPSLLSLRVVAQSIGRPGPGGRADAARLADHSPPSCALSSIIVVALWSTMAKFGELFHYWRQSRLDGCLWAATFTFVILFGVDRGLLYGLTLSFAMLMIRLTLPVFNLKYHVPDSEVYLARPKRTDSGGACHKEDQMKQLPCSSSSSSAAAAAAAAADIEAIITSPGIVVFEFHGPLIFLNAESFKSRFTKTVLRPIKEAQQLKRDLEKQKQQQQQQQQKVSLSRFYVEVSMNSDHEKDTGKYHQLYKAADHPKTSAKPTSNDGKSTAKPAIPIHTVVFDCARVGYLDGKGVEVLTELATELKEANGIQLLFAGCSELILKTLLKSGDMLKDVEPKNDDDNDDQSKNGAISTGSCFLTVHDAVIAAAAMYNAINRNKSSPEMTGTSQRDFQRRGSSAKCLVYFGGEEGEPTELTALAHSIVPLAPTAPGVPVLTKDVHRRTISRLRRYSSSLKTTPLSCWAMAKT
ncbi:hypothetical protein TYRP_010242 [Tyrophagus putrescentiae]|nr:hypothetical protein TYRP_010242 [Tyrophagus putrescentiae]